MTRFQEWLDKLPATNAKQFAFLVLSGATFVLVCAIMLITLMIALHAPPNAIVTVPGIVSDALDSWLLYLSAMGGLGVAQFFAKRKTYASPSPDSERAEVPASPAPAKPSTTTGATVSPPVARPLLDPASAAVVAARDHNADGTEWTP